MEDKTMFRLLKRSQKRGKKEITNRKINRIQNGNQLSKNTELGSSEFQNES